MQLNPNTYLCVADQQSVGSYHEMAAVAWCSCDFVFILLCFYFIELDICSYHSLRVSGK